MKISENWLRRWVPDAPAGAELAERLTMAGLEVDGIEQRAVAFQGVLAGRVLSARPHPEREDASLCEVDAGGAAPRTVVCGAPNARAGLVAAFAPPGAVLPGERRIEAAVIGGSRSEGMLCSELELGIGPEGGGILELPAGIEPGRPLAELLSGADTVLEIELTPNRGDCLGMRGLARDAAAILATELQDLDVPAVPPAIDARFPVRVEAPAACPVYGGRVLRGVDCAAPTPLWIRERLSAAGVRPISAVVDITNYVMLELGQPMHAFDLDALREGIVVRMAAAGERLLLLDGQAIALDGETLCIADARGPVALAGIMGGLDSGVTAGTSNVFLEAAFFSPAAVAGRARAYRLHTDASHRFERGVAFDLQGRAIERASALLLEACGGEPGPCTLTRDEACLPARRPVALRRARISRLLGFPIPDAEVEARLRRLDLQPAAGDDGWSVQPPPHRFDIELEADLIEELARLGGYDTVPAALPAAPARIEASLAADPAGQRCRRLLVERGYREAITYSFVAPEMQAALGLDAEPAVVLANPISSEMSQMRRSLWPGLLQVVDYNRKRQQSRGRFFELGRAYAHRGQGYAEQDRIAGVAFGLSAPRHWQGGTETDFYEVKGDVEALCEALGIGAPDFRAEPAPALHPGQSARIEIDGASIGNLGRIHPAIASRLELPESLHLFELALPGEIGRAAPAYRPIPRFPAVRRDLSVLVAAGIPAGEVLAVARAAAGALLADLQLFDVYAGEGIDSGKKSLALGLTFQASSSTLTDEEVDAVMAAIVDALEDRLGAKLRD